MYSTPQQRNNKLKNKLKSISEKSIEHIEEGYRRIYEENYVSSIPETLEVELKESRDHSIIKQHKSIESIFRHIQDPVHYDFMDHQQITDEKKMLEDHVKFLNQELNILVKKKLGRIEEGLSQKLKKSKANSRFKHNEREDAAMDSQMINNCKMLILLRDQCQYLTAKLTNFQKIDVKCKYETLIKETKQTITKTKMMLMQKKKKNILNGKKISEMDKLDSQKVYFDCQQEYVTLTKKKEDYTKRVDKINEDNANLSDQNAKLEENQLKLRRETVQILAALPNELEEEHQKVMYDTKIRKMQLCLRRREREEEEYKRKYYAVLKQYEKIVQNNSKLDQKLKSLMRDVDNSFQYFKDKQKTVSNNERRSNNNSLTGVIRVWKNEDHNKTPALESDHEKDEDDNCNDVFMITELNNERNTTKISNKKQRVKTEHYISEPSSKTRSQSDYKNNTPKLLPKLKTEYEPEQIQYQERPDSRNRMAKQKVNSGNNWKVTGRRAHGSSEILSNSIREDELDSYADDFDQESPERK